MSKEIMQLAKQISEQIKEDKKYQEYQKALDVIYADKELYEKLENFKERHLKFLYQMYNGTATFEQERHLSQEFHKLLLKKEVNIYFNFGLQIVETLASVYNEIAKDINVDLHFRE